MSQLQRQLEYQQKVIDWVKDKHHELPLTDRQAYNYARYKKPELPSYISLDGTSPTNENIYNNPPIDVEKDPDTSPGALMQLATMGVSDWMADEGSEFGMRSFNHSNAGLLWQAMYGKPKYDIEDTEKTGILEEAGQFLVGMMNPVDLAIMWGTGRLGSMVAGKAIPMVAAAASRKAGGKYLIKKAVEGINKSGLSKAGRRSSFSGTMFKHGMIEQGIGLGGFGAAGSALASAAQISSEITDPSNPRKEFDIESMKKIAYDAAIGGRDGLIIGGMMGGLVKGTMGTNYALAKAKSKTGKALDFQEKWKMRMQNPAGQIAAEAGLFSGGEMYSSGEDINLDNFVRHWAKNAIIIGGMRSPGLVTGKRLKEDIKRVTRGKEIFEIEKKLKNQESLGEKVISSAEKSNENIIIANEARQELLKRDLESDSKVSGLKLISENLDKILDLEVSLDNARKNFILGKVKKSGVESLNRQEKTDYDNIMFYAKNKGTTLQALNQIQRDWLNDISFIKDKDGITTDIKGEYIDSIQAGQKEKLTLSQKKSLVDNLEKFTEINKKWIESSNDIVEISKQNIKDGADFTVPEPIPVERAKSIKKTKADLEGMDAVELLKFAIEELKIEKSELAQHKDLITNEKKLRQLKNVADAFKDSTEGIQYKANVDALKDIIVDRINRGDKSIKATEFEAPLSDLEFSIQSESRGVKAKRELEVRKVIDEFIDPKKTKIPGNLDALQKENFDRSFNMLHRFNQEEYPGRKQKAGAGVGQLMTYAGMKNQNKHLVDFAEFLAVNKKDFTNYTKNDVQTFMSWYKNTKKKSMDQAFKSGASIEDLNLYLKANNINPNSKFISNISAMALAGLQRSQGFKNQGINKNDKTITYQSSKKGAEIVDVPVTSGLIEQILETIEMSKKRGIAPKNKFTDVDGQKHDFLFWNTEKDLLTVSQYSKLLEQLSQNVGIGKITGNMLRKSFSSWLYNLKDTKKRKLSESVNVWADAVYKHQKSDKLTGNTAFDKAYLKLAESAKKEVIALHKEFIDGIFNKKAKLTGRGKEKDFLTQEQLRIVFDNMEVLKKKHEGGLIPIFKSKPQKYDEMPKFHVDDLKTLVRTHLELGARQNEIVPTSQHLTKELHFYDKDLKILRGPDKGQSRPELEFGEISKKQLFPTGESLPEEAINVIVSRLKLKDPNLEVKFQKNPELRTDAGNFAKGIINLTLGKANAQTLFHEYGHKLKSFAKLTGNRELLKSIERGEKMFEAYAKKNDLANYNEYVRKYGKSAKEEYFTDKMADWAAGREANKGFISRASQWAKLLYSNLKKLFFGKKALNRKDLQRILGEKLYKGFDSGDVRMYGSKPKFQISGTPKQQLKTVRKEFAKVVDLLGVKGSKDIKGVFKSLTKLANLDPDLFRLNDKMLSRSGYSEELSIFNQKLFDLKASELTKIKRASDKAKWLDLYSEVERLRVMEPVDINLEMQKRILKSLKVQDGVIFNANELQLKEYLAYIQSFKPIEKRPGSFIDREILMKGDFEQSSPFMTEVKALAMPLHSFFGSIGLKALERKLINHVALEQGHIGKGLAAFEHQTATDLGGGLFGNRAFNKMKEHIWALDQERFNDPTVNIAKKRAAQPFIDEAYYVDSSGKRTLKDNNSDAVKLVKNYKKFTDYYKEELHSILRLKMTESEFEQWKLDNKNVKWIEDGVYVTRAITDEFKMAYDNKHAKIENYVDKASDKLAKEIAAERENVATPTNEQIAKYKQDAVNMVRAEIEQAYSFGNANATARFLMNRNLKLPETIELSDGKKIQTYEYSYDATAQRYGQSMSKFLATIEEFPEYAKLKGFESVGSMKADMQKIKSQIPQWANFVEKSMSGQLGFGEQTPYRKSAKAIGLWTNAVAKLGLSLPTSGIKNLLMGSTQTMSAFRMREFMTGIKEVMNADDRAMVRRSGALQMGTRHYEVKSKLEPYLDAAFKFGLMSPTENFNRYASVLAGRAEQARLSKILRTGNNKSREYINAERRFKDFYKLGEREIDLLKKYGMSRASGVEFTTMKERFRTKRELDNLYQKMNTLAHINTQGAALDLFMPKWAGGKHAKPLLLYKRMAYAATVNTLRNAKLAFKNKEMMRLAMYTGGVYMSGETMMWLYDKLYGKTRPEGDDWLAYMLTTMWKGEFGGLASEFLSPFGFDFTDSLNPAQFANAAATINGLLSAIKGEEFITEVSDKALRKNFALYRGFQDARERGLLSDNTLYRDRIRFNKLHTNYMKDSGLEYHSGYVKDRMTKYRNLIKRSFFNGNPDEFAKDLAVSFFAIAHEIYHAGYTEKGTQTVTEAQAFKEARSRIDSIIEKLNPNPAKIKTKSKLKTKLKTKQFIDWLIDNEGEARAKEIVEEMHGAEALYKEMIGKYQQSISGLWQQNFLEEYYNKYFKDQGLF